MPSSVRLLPLVLFIPLLLASCTTAPHTIAEKSGKAETTPVVDDLFGDLKAGPNENITNYATKIKHAIEDKTYKPESYKGQVCTIRISLARNGLVINATAENGNPELCNATLIAVKQANMPPAPDEKTWEAFKNASLDFSY